MSFSSARKNAGLTQLQVADAMDVNQCVVSFWETGKMAPRAKNLRKLAELYHCTTDELLRDEVKTTATSTERRRTL